MPSKTVSLRELLSPVCFQNCSDIRTRSVSADSRRIQPGDVFFAVRGQRFDGARFIPEAIKNGASAVVSEASVVAGSIPVARVPCVSTAYAQSCIAVQPHDISALRNVGVTGTNGKTTTTWMLRSILGADGIQSGLLGTIESSDGVCSSPSSMTTPGPETLASHLNQTVKAGSTHCVLEVSSHALDQKRCAGIQLEAAAITNVTHDHLDYHGTKAAYLHSKSQIAQLLTPEGTILLNSGDVGCRQILETLPASVPVRTYGLSDSSSDYSASVIQSTHRSQRIRLCLSGRSLTVRLRLPGSHNAENALAAAGLADLIGVAPERIRDGLESLVRVPGRLERIDENQPFQVVVDYAHTPDAVERAVATLRPLIPGRLFCVIGAGGDRDPSKRSQMGRAAAAADVCVLTSDNPRSEQPEAIIEEMLGGIPVGRFFVSEPDRKSAIEYALRAAEPGDAVLIAGKGHECTQEINGRLLDFDDRHVVRQLLNAEISTDVFRQRPVYRPKSA